MFAYLFFSLAGALAEPAGHGRPGATYAEIRRRVGNAMPEKAYELSETLDLLHQLSQESAKLLVELEADCPHK